MIEKLLIIHNLKGIKIKINCSIGLCIGCFLFFFFFGMSRVVDFEWETKGYMSGLGSRLTGRAIECLCYKMFACAHVQHKRSYDSCPELKPSDQVLEYKLISIFYP